MRLLIIQRSANTGPRPGAGPRGVRHRAEYFLRLNALKRFCYFRAVVLKLFMLPNPSSLMQVLTEPLLKIKLKNVLKRVEHKI